LTQSIGLAYTQLDKTPIEIADLIEAYQLRTFCHLELHNPLRAQQDVKWVQIQFASAPEAEYHSLADEAAVAANLQQYETALAILQDLIERSPKEAYAYYQKGRALWALGAKEAAMECFEQAQDRQLPTYEIQAAHRLLLGDLPVASQP
ncbi:MAG: hypothetical protein AAFP02_15020, partial [Bacteroidota bacterium]